jgi:hypothetical protein
MDPLFPNCKQHSPEWQVQRDRNTLLPFLLSVLSLSLLSNEKMRLRASAFAGTLRTCPPQ